MNDRTKLRSRWILFAVLVLLAGNFRQAGAQTTAQQNQNEPAQAQTTNQAPTMADLVGQLGLTPEQIQKWRAINADLKDQQQAANMRLRQSRRALADAVESPNANEELIKQRAHEVSEAQAATTQLQALKEARILQVLTPEQRVKLREIRQRNLALRRNNGQQLPRNGLGRRQDGLQRNTNQAPLGPKQRKVIRQQPKR